ncbi:protein kinase, partial [Oryctes borbonicus]
KHFEISLEDSEGSLYIKDLSRYGTFINKERIPKGKPKKLSHGDIISVGKPEFQVFDYVCSPVKEFLPLELRRKYELSEDLGEGGFGIVKKIFDKETCRPYAVKKIPCNETMHFATNETNIFQMVSHPENILVKKHTSYREVDIVIKLTDFGLSKLLDKHSKAQTRCGTIYFEAPEVREGLQYDYTADIWSLGILLYYMFFRHIPDIVNEEISLDAQDFSNISDHVIALIKAMLVPEPSTRIKINGIMEHPWIQEDQYVKQKLEAVFNQEKEDRSNEFEVTRFPFSSQRTVANLSENRV